MAHETPQYKLAVKILNEYVKELTNDDPIKDEDLEIRRKEAVKDIAETVLKLTIQIELMERAREIIKKEKIKMTKYENLLKAIDEYVEEIKTDKPHKDEFIRLLQKITIEEFIERAENSNKLYNFLNRQEIKIKGGKYMFVAK